VVGEGRVTFLYVNSISHNVIYLGQRYSRQQKWITRRANRARIAAQDDRRCWLHWFSKCRKIYFIGSCKNLYRKRLFISYLGHKSVPKDSSLSIHYLATIHRLCQVCGWYLDFVCRSPGDHWGSSSEQGARTWISSACWKN